MAAFTMHCCAWCAAKNLETESKVCQLPRTMEHANTPPTIPDITDEAGNSPAWLPLLGAGIFALFLGWLLFL